MDLNKNQNKEPEIEVEVELEDEETKANKRLENSPLNKFKDLNEVKETKESS